MLGCTFPFSTHPVSPRLYHSGKFHSTTVCLDKPLASVLISF
jgi:hypothetical protein